MDLYNLVLSAKITKGEGGGGGDEPTGTKEISITQNGEITEDVKSYASAEITTNVPNSYAAGDEGKVVSSGALVVQTSKNVTSNGTVDTTTNNQVVVNVPGITPSGTISITQNGQVDVTQYATADVNVSGGGGALKMGVIRPDAELWKSWTYDKMIVADEGVTIPAYTTAQKQMKASANIETVALDCDNYDYFLLDREIAIPQFNTTSVGKGRPVYALTAYIREIVEIPPNTLGVDSKTYATRDVQVMSTSITRCLYWTSGTAVGVLQSSCGCYTISAEPRISGTSLIIKSPYMYMKGESSTYTSTYWSATTDIRYQYILELYRVPKNNDYFDGFGVKSQAIHTINCAQSGGGTLT